MARLVPGPEYGGFGAFWSLALIVGFGAFLPVELELARAMSTHPGSGLPPRTVRTLGWLVLGCLAAIALGSPLLIPALGGATALAPLVALVAVSAGQFLLRGLLLGRSRLVTHGTLLLADSAVRVALAWLVGLVHPGAGSTAFAWTTVASAALVHLPLLAVAAGRGRSRSSAGPRRGLGAGAPGAHPVPSGVTGIGPAVAHLLVGAVSAQVLLNASPVLVTAIAGEPDARSAAAYVACFTLVRLPLFVVVPLQSALVPLLVGAARRGGTRAVRALVLRVLAGTVALGAAGCAAGGLAGPFLVELLFGEQYRLPGSVVGILAGGAGLHVGLLVLTQVLVAGQQHRRVAGVWLSGIAAGAVVFLAVPDLVLRATLAFTIGTAAALLVTALFLVRSGTESGVADRLAPPSAG